MFLQNQVNMPDIIIHDNISHDDNICHSNRGANISMTNNLFTFMEKMFDRKLDQFFLGEKSVLPISKSDGEKCRDFDLNNVNFIAKDFEVRRDEFIMAKLLPIMEEDKKDDFCDMV